MNRARPGFGRVCVEAVPDRATWESISIPESPGSSLVRVTKFFLPAAEAAGIPPSYLDANRWIAGADGGAPQGTLAEPWHLAFAKQFLPHPRDPMEAYLGARRVAWAGYLVEVQGQGQGRVFAYEIADGALPCDLQARIHAEVTRTVGLRPLYRWIEDPATNAAARAIVACGLPVFVGR